MRDPHDVSHIYDEAGSAKTHHHEFLRAAETRHLADRFRRSDDRLNTHILSRFDKTLVTLGNRRVSQRSAQAVKNLWWVPAGIAGLILLRSIIGG